MRHGILQTSQVPLPVHGWEFIDHSISMLTSFHCYTAWFSFIAFRLLKRQKARQAGRDRKKTNKTTALPASTSTFRITLLPARTRLLARISRAAGICRSFFCAARAFDMCYFTPAFSHRCLFQQFPSLSHYLLAFHLSPSSIHSTLHHRRLKHPLVRAAGSMAWWHYRLPRAHMAVIYIHSHTPVLWWRSRSRARTRPRFIISRAAFSFRARTGTALARNALRIYVVLFARRTTHFAFRSFVVLRTRALPRCSRNACFHAAAMRARAHNVAALSPTTRDAYDSGTSKTKQNKQKGRKKKKKGKGRKEKKKKKNRQALACLPAFAVRSQHAFAISFYTFLPCLTGVWYIIGCSCFGFWSDLPLPSLLLLPLPAPWFFPHYIV